MRSEAGKKIKREDTKSKVRKSAKCLGNKPRRKKYQEKYYPGGVKTRETKGKNY